MPTRVSILIDFTTNPTNLSAAAPRSGGFSETIVTQSENQTDILARLNQLLIWRAGMLPKFCAVVGYRLGNVQVNNQNQLIYLGTSGAITNWPGAGNYTMNQPQDSVLLSLDSTNGVNSTRHSLRCAPDEVMSGGEFQPDAAFTARLNLFVAQLTTGFWGWFGRDLSQPAVSVMSIDNTGVVTLAAPLAVAEGDFVKFRRCRDQNGKPIKGSFQVKLVNGNQITLINWLGQVVTKQNGLLRKDVLAFLPFSTLTGTKAASHKVGNAIARYRGRRSKKTA